MKKKKLYKSRIGILDSKSMDFHRIDDIKKYIGLLQIYNASLIIDCYDEFHNEILRQLDNVSGMSDELIKKENRNKKNVSS